MQISSVKMYNLSHGKSLPEWPDYYFTPHLPNCFFSDIQRKIELIQDFEMPTVCTSIKVSRDGQFILAAGEHLLSLKFERCLDSDVVAFDILSNDYSKLTRIPKFGRDFAYHYPSCDLYFVWGKVSIFRLNLEQGRLLNSLHTDAVEHNACDINPVHQVLASGTAEVGGAYVPRVRSQVGMLDCALSSVTEGTKVEGLPSVSALKFNGSLTMAVGTSTGQVLLYDLRASHPLLVKYHYYGLPIKSVNFQDHLDLVLTADSKIIKIWNKDKGKVFSPIEPQTNINDTLGPAPRWCSFLDNLTEELKESPESTIYDDYKFVTRKDLENLGEVCLTSWDLLRAYMHRFFMDIRLYHKLKTMADPFAYDEYRKDKIRQKIGVQDAESTNIGGISYSVIVKNIIHLDRQGCKKGFLKYMTSPKVYGHPLDLSISTTPVADSCVKLSTQQCNLHRQTLAIEWPVLKSSVTFKRSTVIGCPFPTNQFVKFLPC
uniref:Nucleolar protein 10 n=1 Tax=Oncorhynchus tshawytscha TaxID=74940 RepID=A0A8C8J7U0_ONCTS